MYNHQSVSDNVIRGDIFFVAGSKFVNDNSPIGSRPAIIVSNDTGNKYSPTVEVVYLTSQEKKPLPTHVPIVCKVPSIAMCESVQTISKDRLTSYVRSCTEEEMKSIDSALLCSLGISIPVTAPAPTEEVKANDSALVELNVYKALYQQLLDRITTKI